jgi:Spy/CpxP family protein refolding chaperone
MKGSRIIVLNFFVFFLALAVTLAGSYALGLRVWFERRRPRFDREGKRTRMKHFLHKKLHLSEEQRAKFEAMGKDFRERMDVLRKQTHTDREELTQLLLKSEVDREKIEKKIDAISMAQKEVQLEVIDHLLKLKKILTPEQQREFFSMIIKRMSPGGRRPPRRRGPRERMGPGKGRPGFGRRGRRWRDREKGIKEGKTQEERPEKKSEEDK